MGVVSKSLTCSACRRVVRLCSDKTDNRVVGGWVPFVGRSCKSRASFCRRVFIATCTLTFKRVKRLASRVLG